MALEAVLVFDAETGQEETDGRREKADSHRSNSAYNIVRNNEGRGDVVSGESSNDEDAEKTMFVNDNSA